MKLLKSFILLFSLASIVISCGDDNDTPSFDLSSDNITGTYAITKLIASKEETTTTSGETVKVSDTSVKGDTFQIDLVLSTNGTYTISGEYRRVSVITVNNGSAPKEEAKIITIDGSGNYVLNSSDKEITLNSSDSDDSFVGTYKIVSFNEKLLAISKETEIVDKEDTVTEKIEITFERK